jgi:hypothetical protein
VGIWIFSCYGFDGIGWDQHGFLFQEKKMVLNQSSGQARGLLFLSPFFMSFVDGR